MSELVFGRHAVRECLRAKRRPAHRLWMADGVKPAPVLDEILALAQAQKTQIRRAPHDQLERRVPHNHGVILETGAYPFVNLEDIFERAQQRNQPPFVLMLDTIQDPQNLGTLIRAADATGAHGVVLAQHRSATITPAVLHASSGAAEHLLVAQVVNLARAIDEMKEREIWVAALQGDERAQDVYTTNLTGALCIIVGNEGDGVRRLLRDKADFLLKLPMLGAVESLNAAVAGSVALYEALRQRTRLPNTTACA